MSRPFDQIGRALAASRKAVARALGVSFTFSHRGAATVTLYGMIQSDETLLIEENGIATEVRVLTMQIATGQTGFTASSSDVEPITPGDTIVYLSRTLHAVNPIQKDKYGRTFTVKFVEEKRLSIGAA